MMERLGVALFRATLLLLPAPLRARAGEEMLEVFRERHRRARGAGVLAAWTRELGGVAATAVRARVRTGTRPPPAGGGASWSDLVETFAQDVRYALRGLARRPTFTVLAVLTFGLGIAASTAMFSVVDAVLLRPLPYPDPGEVVSVYPTNPSMRGHPTLGGAAERGTFSFPEYQDLAAGSGDALEAIALAIGWGGAILAGEEGPPERIPVGITTPDLFSGVLRVEPLLGRTFLPEDEGADAVLLSEGFWRRRYGADPSLVNRTIPLGSEPHTVIGVLPEGAAPSGYDVDAWLLFGGDENRGNHSYYALGRLRDGVTPAQATEALTAVMRAADEATASHGHGVNVFARQADETRGVRGPLALLTGAALVLLLVACGNVAALLVGAAIDRERELAVRGAMGAGRGRLARQLLTESLVLAGAATVVGIALTAAATRGLLWLAPEYVPRVAEAVVDGRALGVAVGLSLLCGLLFGLIPAVRFSRTDLRDSMIAGGRASTGSGARLQGVVVVGELALATVLLVGAGLLGRTVLALNAIDPGFAVDELLAVSVAVPSGHLYAGEEDPVQQWGAVDEYYRRVQGEIAALPGVRGVALTSHLALSGSRANNDVQPEGYDGDPLIAERRFVSGEYFDVMGIRIVEGRGIQPSDDRRDAGDGLVTVVSESLARRAWPDQSAVGKRLTYWGSRETTVVGVAADLKDESLQRATDFAFYVPMRQGQWNSGSFVVRTVGDPASLIPAVRQRIWSVDAGVAIPTARPFASYVANHVADQVYRARLVAVFSALAALFSLMGVYGVTARSVAARTREIGIRVALGAKRAGVLRLVLQQVLRLAIWGAVAGVAAAFVLTRFIEAYLFEVEATDAITLVGTALLLATASVAAALAPGRRAARVDPVVALREE